MSQLGDQFGTEQVTILFRPILSTIVFLGGNLAADLAAAQRLLQRDPEALKILLHTPEPEIIDLRLFC